MNKFIDKLVNTMKVNSGYLIYSRILIVVFISFCKLSLAQFHQTDSIGNFFVVKNKIIWQKHFSLSDVNDLDSRLKSNHFTSNLDILDYSTSSMSNPTQLIGNNLPAYAQSDFEAFIVVDMSPDSYRIILKDITFTKYVEMIYFHGRKQYSGRGRLDYYLLRPDGSFKRNNGTYHILQVLGNAFDEIFNADH